MKNKKAIVLIVLFFFVLFLLLLLSLSINWIGDNFGGIGFDEIMFHMVMPLKGTASSYIQGYVQKALLPAIGITAEVIAVLLVLRMLFKRTPGVGAFFKDRWPRCLTPILCVALIVAWIGGETYRAQKWFGFIDYARSAIDHSAFFEAEYVKPDDVKITFPEQKRNLVYILMESAETSTQDRANGGLFSENYIPEMTALAEQNISFSQSDLFEGAAVAPMCGWTMSGMLAETAGIPLKLHAVNADHIGDEIKNYRIFLPGAVTLGDILEREGYRNVFLAGSDFDFGGRKSYCTGHGNYEILDLLEARARGRIPEDYYVWWGFEDCKLYDWAKEELLALAAGEAPFNLTLLTVDTHQPDGYVCEKCRDRYGEQYANVWRCASEQVAEFVAWIQAQDFYENTTVVIAGDHCSMNRDFYGEYTYKELEGEVTRKVYNAIINSPIQPVKEKNRQFTTLDMFPTTLAALGVQIEGDRLGLGVNLFSGEQTLAERYGYEHMFEEIRKQSSYYNEVLMYPR